MNEQCSLNQELMFYKFKLGHNIVEVTKDICYAKGEAAVNHRWFKKFYPNCKNLNYQARLGKPKMVDSKPVFQAMEANLVSSTWRVSGELSISQSGVVCHFHDYGKSIDSF